LKPSKLPLVHVSDGGTTSNFKSTKSRSGCSSLVSATIKDDLDAYEIPKYFWKTARSCEIARIAFLKALQYRLNWEDGSKYSYTGTLIDREGFPAVVFNMTEGKSVERHPRHAEAE